MIDVASFDNMIVINKIVICIVNTADILKEMH